MYEGKQLYPKISIRKIIAYIADYLSNNLILDIVLLFHEFQTFIFNRINWSLNLFRKIKILVLYNNIGHE